MEPLFLSVTPPPPSIHVLLIQALCCRNQCSQQLQALKKSTVQGFICLLTVSFYIQQKIHIYHVQYKICINHIWFKMHTIDLKAGTVTSWKLVLLVLIAHLQKLCLQMHLCQLATSKWKSTMTSCPDQYCVCLLAANKKC